MPIVFPFGFAGQCFRRRRFDERLKAFIKPFQP
jgi:hypothetical protein